MARADNAFDLSAQAVRDRLRDCFGEEAEIEFVAPLLGATSFFVALHGECGGITDFLLCPFTVKGRNVESCWELRMPMEVIRKTRMAGPASTNSFLYQDGWDRYLTRVT